MSELQLGKLESVHPTSPFYLQRAAVLAVLSFIFFLLMLIVFSYLKNILYFLLATAFMIIHLFTLFSWFMQRKNEVKIYENGFAFKKKSWLWDELEAVSVERNQTKIRGEVKNKAGEKLILTEAISGVDSILKRIDAEIARRR